MKLANPAPLGLSGFALTTWMLSLVNSGWYSSPSVPLVLASAFAFGGTAQFFAGLMEMPRGNTFGFVAFCSYGAFWWSFATFLVFFDVPVVPAAAAAGAAPVPLAVPAVFIGWWLFMWGVFTLYMFIASLASNRAAQAIFLTLTITFVLLAVGEWTGNLGVHFAGGYAGLVTAACAFYLAAAEVINDTHGRMILPIGAPRPRPTVEEERV